MTLTLPEILLITFAPMLLFVALLGVAGWLLWRRLRAFSGLAGIKLPAKRSVSDDDDEEDDDVADPLAPAGSLYQTSDDEDDAAPSSVAPGATTPELPVKDQLALFAVESERLKRGEIKPAMPPIVDSSAARAAAESAISQANLKMLKIDAEVAELEKELAQIPELLSGGLDDPKVKRMMRVSWDQWGLCVENANVRAPIDTCDKFTQKPVEHPTAGAPKECVNCVHFDVPAGQRALQVNPAFLHMTKLRAPHELLRNPNPAHVAKGNEIAKRGLARRELELQVAMQQRIIDDLNKAAS